jgi:hypothetical protein
VYLTYTPVILNCLCVCSFFWRNNPPWARASSFTRFLNHTQRPITVGRTPLDEWSARRRELYLTTHNTHNRQASMPPVGFEPTISADERPQTHVLDRATTGTGNCKMYTDQIRFLATVYAANTNVHEYAWQKFVLSFQRLVYLATRSTEQYWWTTHTSCFAACQVKTNQGKGNTSLVYITEIDFGLCFDLCHIYRQSVENRSVTSIYTSEAFPRRDKYPQVTNISQYYSCRTRINTLQTKSRLLYLETQSVPRCKHFSSRL